MSRPSNTDLRNELKKLIVDITTDHDSDTLEEVADNYVDQILTISQAHEQQSHPSKAELRAAILKRVLKIDVYDDTKIDEDEAKAAADDLVKLFQAREQQLLTELLGELPEKYKHNHHHDIQTQDGKYKCLNCRKTPDEIAGNDNMGNCPHFRSYNKALSDVVSVIQSKIGELNG